LLFFFGNYLNNKKNSQSASSINFPSTQGPSHDERPERRVFSFQFYYFPPLSADLKSRNDAGSSSPSVPQIFSPIFFSHFPAFFRWDFQGNQLYSPSLQLHSEIFIIALLSATVSIFKLTFLNFRASVPSFFVFSFSFFCYFF
jgi:hypothetical protein